LTADWVVEELRKIAGANMADYMKSTPEGDPYLDFSALTRDQTATLSEVTVEDFLDRRGDDARAVRRVKFKLHDKRAALVDLGRHLGLFVEMKHKHDTHVEVDISSVRDTVLSALARLAAAQSAADGDPGAEPRSITEVPA
jgi:phage terminase small subunit